MFMFKDVKFPLFLWYMVIIWPVLSYTDHTNAIILTFISFTADVIMYIKKCKDMMYSEFTVITGKPSTLFREHVWLVSIIITRTIQMVSVWLSVVCVHMFSPIFGVPIHVRILGVYITILVHVLCKAIYHKVYKQWAITYCSVSTNDAELPFTRRQTFD
jgi:hypothetical protein